MGSQVTSSIFSGPCFGDSTPSESSPASAPITDSLCSSPLLLGGPLLTLKESTGSALSDYCATEISETRLDISPQVPENTHQAVHPPHGFSVPCQDNAANFCITSLRTSNSIGNSDPPGQLAFESSEVDAALPFDHVNTGEMDPNPCVVAPKTFVTRTSLLESPDISGLPTKALSLDPDRPAPQSSFAVDPDDALSRTTLNGEKDDMNTESALVISAGYCSNASSAPLLDLTTNSPTEPFEPGPLTESDLTLDSSSKAVFFTPGGRSDLDSVSDVDVKCSLSDPYTTPGTNFREHGLTFTTDVVDTQELPSSSPPSSSPLMNFSLVASSSPMPSSSPLDRMTQTPPTSPPAAINAYKRGTGQEGLYADEIQPQCQLEDVLNDVQNQDSNDATPLYYPPSMSAPPFATNFDNQLSEPTSDQYTQKNTSFIAITYPQSTSSSYIPAAEQSYEHDENVEPPADQVEAHRTFPMNVIPAPKRSTVAGQRAQQKKLSRPFRSPVMHAPVRLAPKQFAGHFASLVGSNTVVLKEVPASVEQSGNALISASSQPSDTKIKHRTTRAASQFKSPMNATSAASADEVALVRLTPTIQSLERKLQLLRRALKVREDLQEEVLAGLVKKWSEAGREVAWEVWDNVKDNANSEGLVKGKKRAIEESWGWDEGGDTKKPKVERNWGWDMAGDEPESPKGEETLAELQEQGEEADDENVTHATLGTMLIQLGIPPETLGWDEEEGTFVDQ